MLTSSGNQLGTRRRRLTMGGRALLAPAHLREGETYADLAAGFTTGTTTAFRYIREVVDALAAAAPTLAREIEIALRKAFSRTSFVAHSPALSVKPRRIISNLSLASSTSS